MKIIAWRVIVGILGTFLILLGIAVGVFYNELKSLASLRKLDDYPMYSMTYYGDYGFKEFLAVGAKSDACTAFVTRDMKD